jgi:alginate O-acetyltransferase complex protein AlgI
MLFNSPEFIFAFLPLTLAVYFFLTHREYYRESKLWLVIASLFFYGWWNPKYLFLIIFSIAINFAFASWINKTDSTNPRKTVMTAGVIFNIGLLGYFKYANFFIENFNSWFENDFNLLHIILPLGISFFTFQQIAYLVDTYKGKVKEQNLVNYALFVSFFPQLIAGPICHHKEIMPQLLNKALSRFNWENFAKGIFIFNMGLAKKMIIADTFGKIVNKGYANYDVLTAIQSWITAFAYTVQLYFDFSGYSDMAIGLGLLFNIAIPINFWSPHKSANIQEFYRRWHITLSRFMREYIYIPLGGNRKSEARTHLNLLLTFIIGGFWHGANWTFVIWGALNGIAMVVHRLYQRSKIGMPYAIAVFVTFLFVLLVRIFFRADNYSIAMDVLQRMFGLSLQPSENFVLIDQIYDAPLWVAGIVLLFLPNSNEMAERFVPNWRFATMLMLMLILNLTFLNSTIQQDFLYFDF